MRKENFLESSTKFIHDEAVRLQHAFKAPELKGEEQEMLSVLLEQINIIFAKINTIPAKQEKLIKFQIERALICVTDVISAYDPQSETVITALHAFNDALAAHLQAHFPQINIKSNVQRQLPSLNLESMELEFSGLERLDAMLDLSGFPKEDLDLLTRAPQHQPKKNNVDVLDLLFGNSVEDKETFEVNEDKETGEPDSEEIDSGGVDSEVDSNGVPPKKVVDDFDASTTYPPKPKNKDVFPKPGLMPLSATSESMSSTNPATRELMLPMSSPGNYYAAPASRASNLDDDAPTESSSALSNAGAVSSAHNFTQGLVPLDAPTLYNRVENQHQYERNYWNYGSFGLLTPISSQRYASNPNETFLQLDTSLLKAKSLYALAVTCMPLDLQFAANQGEYDAAIQAHKNDTTTDTILFIFHNNQWHIVFWKHTSGAGPDGRIKFTRDQQIINIVAPRNLARDSDFYSLSQYLFSIRGPSIRDRDNRELILNRLIRQLGREINGLLTSDLRNIVLLEWQTNRQKKLNGIQQFRFPGGFGLNEIEPVRIIQDKDPLRLMQYETAFGPTKKRLLIVPHIILDNRRKYRVTVPLMVGEGAAARHRQAIVNYVIYEMGGPDNISRDAIYSSGNIAIVAGSDPRVLATNTIFGEPTPPPLEGVDSDEDEFLPYPRPPNALQQTPMQIAAVNNAPRPAAAAANPAVPAQRAQIPTTAVIPAVPAQPVAMPATTVIPAAVIPPVPAQTPSPASTPASTPEIPWVVPANARLSSMGVALRKIYSPEVNLNVAEPNVVAPTKELLRQFRLEPSVRNARSTTLTRLTENKNEEKTPGSNQPQPQKLSITESIEKYYSLSETENIWNHLSECSRLLDIEKDHLETLLGWMRSRNLQQELDLLGKSVMKKNKDETTAAFKQFVELNLASRGAGLLNDLTKAGISAQYRQQQRAIVNEESLHYKARHYHAFGKVLVDCLKKLGDPYIFSPEVSQVFLLPEYIYKFAKLEKLDPANQLGKKILEEYEHSLEVISASYINVKREYDDMAAVLASRLKAFRQKQIQDIRENVRRFMDEDPIFCGMLSNAEEKQEFTNRFAPLTQEKRIKTLQALLKNTERGRKFLQDHPDYRQDRDPLNETISYWILKDAIFEFRNDDNNDISEPLILLLMKEKILKYALEIIEIAQALKPLRRAMNSSVKLKVFFNEQELRRWQVTAAAQASNASNNKVFNDLLLYPLDLLSLIQIDFLLSAVSSLPDVCFGDYHKKYCLECLEELRNVKSKKNTAITYVTHATTESGSALAALRPANVTSNATITITEDAVNDDEKSDDDGDGLTSASVAASFISRPARYDAVPAARSNAAARGLAAQGLPSHIHDDEKSDGGDGLTSMSVSASLNWSRPARYDAVPALRSNAPAQGLAAQGLPSLTPAAAIIPVKNTPPPSGPMSGTLSGPISGTLSGPMSGPMGGGAYQAVPATRGANAYTNTSGDVTASTSSTSGLTSMVGGGLQGLPSLTPPPAAATPSAPALAAGQGYALLRTCGLPAYGRPDGNATLWDKLTSIATNLGYDVPEKQSSTPGYSYIVKLKKVGVVASIISSGAFASAVEAQNMAALLVFEHFMQQPEFNNTFFIKVPPDNDGNPTSTLLTFFQMHSMYRQGDELQGIYRSYMHTNDAGTSLPVFECRLTYKGVELAMGRGDTKRRAREEASRRTLRKLALAFLQLQPGDIVKLNAMMGNKGYLAAAQKQVWLKQQEQWIAQQRGWVRERLAAQANLAMPAIITKLEGLERELVSLAGEFSTVAQVMDADAPAEALIDAAIAKRESIQKQKQLTELGNQLTAALSTAPQSPAEQQPDANAPTRAQPSASLAANPMALMPAPTPTPPARNSNLNTPVVQQVTPAGRGGRR